MKETYFYEKLQGSKVRCNICSHFCVINDGDVGKCGVRKNINGKFFSLSYKKLAVMNVDPIEKKPFFHYLPGTKTLSIASEGCSFFCRNCQNWDISQGPKEREVIGKNISPKEVVNFAVKNNIPSISYTYTDPTSFFEYAYDTMVLAHKKGIKNCFVSHAFMSKKAVKKIIPYLGAINIDIKSFSEDFYRENCGARLKPVLDNAILMKKNGVWVEIATLVVPTLSDSEEMLKDIALFINKKLGNKTPWHVNRFSGSHSYKLKHLPNTSLKTLKTAYNIGKSVGLKFVYIGNTQDTEHQNTYCPKCQALCVVRDGVSLERYDHQGRCLKCNYSLNIWD